MKFSSTSQRKFSIFSRDLYLAKNKNTSQVPPCLTFQKCKYILKPHWELNRFITAKHKCIYSASWKIKDAQLNT